MSRLRLALSKGALLAPVVAGLESAGVDVSPLDSPGRRLHLSTEETEFIVARAADVPTYVEWGAVDVGFVGSDVLMEGDFDVFELLDLGCGRCEFVLAGPAELADQIEKRPAGPLKIATKYPKVAADYLAEKGLQAEIIKLYGSMELAPLVGLADGIVDLMATGRTLAENNLEVIDTITTVSCRLIANYVSYKIKSVEINDLVSRLST
jgi:ATP phosphoribosyltransferase